MRTRAEKRRKGKSWEDSSVCLSTGGKVDRAPFEWHTTITWSSNEPTVVLGVWKVGRFKGKLWLWLKFDFSFTTILPVAPIARFRLQCSFKRWSWRQCWHSVSITFSVLLYLWTSNKFMRKCLLKNMSRWSRIKYLNAKYFWRITNFCLKQ